jgi:DNA-binding beta-propeller fold protein YncE
MMILFRILIILSSVFMLTLGCMADTSGIVPPDDQLNYPVGLAMAPGDDYLLVANSNFDLYYNTGTLQVIDLTKLDAIEESLRDDPTLLDADCLSDDKQYLRSDCKQVYVPTERVVKAEDTIHLGSFASDLKLIPSGKRAMIPTRGDKSIIIADVYPDGDPVVDCGQGQTQKCDAAHKVKSNSNVALPLEPYLVASLEYKTAADTVVTLGFSTHLSGGEVSLFRIDRNGELDAEMLNVVENLADGSNGIAVKSDPDLNPFNQEIYVSGRYEVVPHLEVVMVLADPATGYVADNSYFGPVDDIYFGTDMAPVSSGPDARGIAVPSSGDTAYLVTRAPESLIELDTLEREMINMTSVGNDPSTVALFEYVDEETSEVTTYAFIICFISNQVYIINTDDFDLMQVVRSTGSAPQAITFDKKRTRAYIANFRESTITILQAKPPFDYIHFDLQDPNNPEEYVRANMQIGKPNLPESHN